MVYGHFASNTALGTIGNRGSFQPAPSHVEIAEFGDQPRQALKAHKQLMMRRFKLCLHIPVTVCLSIYPSIHRSIYL